jgi:hypothetical protein
LPGLILIESFEEIRMSGTPNAFTRIIIKPDRDHFFLRDDGLALKCEWSVFRFGLRENPSQEKPASELVPVFFLDGFFRGRLEECD